MFKKTLLTSTLLLTTVALIGCTSEKIPPLGGDKDEHGCIGSAGYTWNEEKEKCIRPWEEEITQQTKAPETEEHQAPATLDNTYIVTNGSILIDSKREQTNFSVYKTDGTLVKKIDLPDDAIKMSAVGKNAVYGNKIYTLTGSRDVTHVSEIDPFTGKSQPFNFTKTTSTNVGNVLFAIVAWAVSSDNQTLAWVDTEGVLHTASHDGSTHKTYPPKKEGKVISAKIQFSNNNSDLYVWTDFFLRKLDLSSGTFSELFKTENGEFSISPNDKYITYSNFDIPFAIYNSTSKKTTPVTTPTSYDFYGTTRFSPDENIIYFSAEVFQGKTDYYTVQSDGTNMTKLKNKSTQNGLTLLPENHALTQCEEGACLIDLNNPSKKPIIISNEWFLGSFSK